MQGSLLLTFRAEDLFAQINRLHPSLEVTFEISHFKAIFLDLHFFKGPGWRQTGILDHEVHQKPVNRYLYLPFRLETPRNTLRGMIIGELIRFITHSSSYLAFLRTAKLFWFRLRARGYPHAFLQRAFASAPGYQPGHDSIACAPYRTQRRSNLRPDPHLLLRDGAT